MPNPPVAAPFTVAAIPNGSITNAKLTNSSVTINTTAGHISGGGSVALGASLTLSLPAVGTAGTYGGSGNFIQSLTTDAQGRVSAVTVAASPTTYYQTVQSADVDVTQRGKLDFASAFAVTDDAGGNRTKVTIANAGVTNAMLQNSSVTVNTTAGRLTGGGSVSLGSSLTLDLATTAVTAASYGDASHVATFTVDGFGRLTAAASTAIAIGDAAITFANEAANTVFAGPTTGAAATPSWRALVNADLPTSGVSAGSYSYVTVNTRGVVTAGSLITLTGGTGINAIGDLSTNRTVSVDQSFSPTWTGVHTFSNYLALSTISTPATPTTGIRLYSVSRNGIERPAYVDNDGIQVVLSRDILFVVRNTSGATLTRGTVVYVTGATGSIATVDKAQADSTMAKLPAVGIVAADIPNNAFGRVIKSGFLGSYDTSAFAAGDTLYVSAVTPGALTNVAPSHPSVEQTVGVVTASGVGNGEIDVDVFPLNLHRIDGTNRSTFAIGDGTGTTKSYLVKNAAGTGTLSWNPSANRTLTLPDATDTLVGQATTDTLTNKTISGSSNTLTNIGNSSLVNSSLTVTAGTGLSGGGSVALGSSVTLSLPSVGPGAGTIGGSGSAVQSVTLDAQGRVTAAAAVTLHYQTVQANTTAQTQRSNLNFASTFTLTDSAGSDRTSVDVASAGITNAMLQNSSLTVTAGTGLSGGGSVSLGGSVTLSLPSVGPGAGTIGGSPNAIQSITLDAQGRVTAAATVSNVVTGSLTSPKIPVAGGAQALSDSNLSISGNTLQFNVVTTSSFNIATAATDTIGANLSIQGGNAGPVSAAAGKAGGTLTAQGGTGAAASATQTAGAGGQGTFQGGTGGAGNSSNPGATGGLGMFSGGSGGAGTASAASGSGGDVNIIGGFSPASAGGGRGNGGSIVIRGGQGTTNGTVTIGATNTSAIAIGASGVTTTVTGGLTQLTGAVSLSANAASSFTTSSGALTITSAAAATWDSADGTVKAATVDRSTAGTMTLGGTATTVQLAAGTTLSGAAGAGALSLGSMTGNTTLPTGNLSWAGASGKTGSLVSTAATLTITAGSASTWDSNNGTVKAATLDRSTSGTLVIGGTATSAQLAAGVSLSGAAGAGALSLGSMTGDTTLPTGAVSWTGASGKAVSLTSTAAAITITAASASTWDSANGTVKAATFDRTTAGTLTVAGTATAITLAANTTISDAKTLTATYNAIGTAATVHTSWQNNTAAANGAPQYSPVLELTGTGWNPTAGASRQVKYSLQAVPVQGSIDPGVDFVFTQSSNAVAAEAFRVFGYGTYGGIRIGGSIGVTFTSGLSTAYNSTPQATTQTLLPDRSAVQGYSVGAPSLLYYDFFGTRGTFSQIGSGDVAPLAWAAPYITTTSYDTVQTNTPYGLLMVGGQSRFAALTDMGAVTVTPTGGSATSYTYKVVAVDRSGNTTLAGTGTTSTGAASLTASAFNTLTWTAVNAAVYYDVYLTSIGQAQWLGSVTTNSFKDTIGTAASSGRYTSPGAGSVFAVVAAGIAASGGSGSAQTYFIYAVDADGHITAATTKSSAPTATAGNPVTLTWTPVGGADHYIIARGSNTSIIGQTNLQIYSSGVTTVAVTVPNGGLVRTGGTTVTATIANGHGLRVGDTFTLTSADANFASGTYTVATTASATVFTYSNAGSNVTSANVAISYTGPTVPGATFIDYAYPARTIGSATRNNTADATFDGQVVVNAQTAGNAMVHKGNASNFSAQELWEDSAGSAHFGVDDAGFPSIGSRFEWRETFLWATGTTIASGALTNSSLTNGASVWVANAATGALGGFGNSSGQDSVRAWPTGITINPGSTGSAQFITVKSVVSILPQNQTNLYAVIEYPITLSVIGANNVTFRHGMSNTELTAATNPTHPKGWYFEKASTDTNWQACTDDGTTTNKQNTNVAPTANRAQMFRIEFYGSGTTTGAATVKFYIDSTLVATSTTNVYTAAGVFFNFGGNPSATATSQTIALGPMFIMYNLVPTPLIT